MTAEAIKGSSLAAEVSSCLDSPWTVTEQTLNILRALLGLNREQKGIKAAPKHPNSSRQPKKPAVKPNSQLQNSADTKNQQGSKVNSWNNHGCGAEPLHSIAGRKLATKVFNSGLRFLGEAVKETKQLQNGHSTQEKPCSPQKSVEKAIPLRQRTNNQSAKLSCAISFEQERLAKIEVISDCIISALWYLHRLDSDTTQPSQDASVQLEQGSLMLLDRLISLRLIQKATQHVISLSRLRSFRSKQIIEPQPQPSDIHNAHFPRLLTVDIKDVAKPQYLLITSLQSQLLRLLILVESTNNMSTLLGQVKMHKNGSPAFNVLEGNRLGFLNNEKAGEQLRTISQAMIKLYSISLGAALSSSDSARVSFSLLTESLLVRCKSWTLLDHKPQLDQEIWTPLLRGAKKVVAAVPSTDLALYAHVMDEVNGLIVTIQSTGHTITDARATLSYCLSLAEKCNDIPRALKWLDQISQDVGTDVIGTIITGWHKALLMHQLGSTAEASVLEAFENARHCLEQLLATEGWHDEQLLVYVARLRKVCLSVLLDTKQDCTASRIRHIRWSLTKCCVQILLNLPRIPHEFLRLLSSTHESKSKTLRVDLQHVATSMSKCVESLMDLVDYSQTAGLISNDELDQSLKICNVHLKELLNTGPGSCLDDSLQHFIQCLCVRLSNGFWQRFQKCPSTGTSDLEILERSISAVSCCKLKYQTSALITTKLEKLAGIALQNGDARLARLSFEQNIQHYVAAGALHDATETALTSPSRKVWSITSTARYRLGQSLRSFINISLTHDLHSATSAEYFYDDNGLTPIERCVLLEGQILASTDHSFSQKQIDSLRRQIDCLIRSSEDYEYHIYRKRFLHQLIQAGSKFQRFPIKEVITEKLIARVCVAGPGEKVTVHLAKYGDWLDVSLRLQIAIIFDNLTAENISDHVRQFCSVVLRLPNTPALESSLNDVNFCVKQIDQLSALCQRFDNTQDTLQCLLAICHLLALSDQANQSKYVLYLVRLAVLHNRLGNMARSKEAFAAAEALLSQSAEPAIGKIKWALAYVDYLLDMKDYCQAERIMQKAHADFLLMFPAAEITSGRDRMERDAILSQSALMASRISFCQGNIPMSCLFSRQAVKIGASIWQALRLSHTYQEDRISKTLDNGPMGRLENDISSLHITHPLPQTSAIRPYQETTCWSYVDLYFSTLWHMSTLSMHNGLFQDALYYGDQLQKTAKEAGSCSWSSRADRLLALLYVKGGKHDMSRDKIQNLVINDHPDGNCEDAMATLMLIEAMTEVEEMDQAKDYLIRMIESMNVVQYAVCEPPAMQATRSSRQKPTSGSTKAANNKTFITLNANHESILAVALKLRMVLDGDFASDLAKCNISVCQATGLSLDANPIWRPVVAQTLLKHCLASLSADAVQCILAESAIALPVQSQARSRPPRVSVIQAAESPIKAKTLKRSQPPSKTRTKAVKHPVDLGEKLLTEANSVLPKVNDQQLTQLPTDALHLTGKLRSNLSLLTSAMTAPFNLTSLELVLQNLQAKDFARQREIAVALAEARTKKKEQILSWPERSSIVDLDEPGEKAMLPSAADLADIPASWTVISLSLAGDENELLVGKLNSAKPPFILRIPLSRSELDMPHEPLFGFQEAKLELDTIVAKANASCHDKRGQGDKKTRLTWFDERQSLDERLADWLLNIENLWLGGFRGLMSPMSYSNDVVVPFEKALSNALGKYLPSRQRMTNQTKCEFDLHINVFELFLGLGHPDHHELDDAITDLLYFVIDILQFRGERNAYDEIDFDTLASEVLDILRTCHEKLAQAEVVSGRHIILVVDKELESFPWESLPCLHGQSVSRMPSLSTVLQRVRQIRGQTHSVNGYTVSSKKGAYMLNPSADLLSTETTFGSILETSLPSFTSSVRVSPSEGEFESALRDHDLFLYFGHGSGAQYIRGRTIRALDSCAVTLLLGCSSAKMTQCGKMESHGMPSHYVGGLSGCMAMVGTLWDVTDRDIDRFAMKLMVEWGLIEEDDEVRKTLERNNKRTNSTKSKVKERAKSKKLRPGVEAKRGKVSLDDAVDKGREACVLRYLNGAAPVMYGVPVFLSCED